MDDEEYDDEYDDASLDELRRMSDMIERRLETWTRFVSSDGRMTIHCPISEINGIIRQVASDEEAIKLGGFVGGDHLVLVNSHGYSVIVAVCKTEGEAEEYIAEFMAVRGIEKM